MVIGEDVEEQLAPYNEEITVPPYRKYDADPAWLFRFYAEKHPDAIGEPTLEQLVAFLNEEWKEDGEKYGVDDVGLYSLSTYNPASKWDWYTVGGRWRGFFKLTAEAMDRATLAKVGDPGVFDNEPTYDADVVLRGDVDAEGMRAARGEVAGKRWDKAQELFSYTPLAEPWDVLRERVIEAGGTVDDARAQYRDQPRVKIIQEHDEACRKEERWDDMLLSWDGHLESYDVPRDEYVQRARNNAICPYAYVKDGEWFAPGEMGWWGMSSDTDEDQARFAREFNQLFDALPDDTILTMVDCHI